MYKDKDRQRQAVREATRRWRERKGITSEVECDTQGVIPTKPKHRVISIKDMVPHWTPDDPIPPQSYNPMMEGYAPPT